MAVVTLGWFDSDSAIFDPESLPDQTTWWHLHIWEMVVTQTALETTLLFLHSDLNYRKCIVFSGHSQVSSRFPGIDHFKLDIECGRQAFAFLLWPSFVCVYMFSRCTQAQLCTKKGPHAWGIHAGLYRCLGLEGWLARGDWVKQHPSSPFALKKITAAASGFSGL